MSNKPFNLNESVINSVRSVLVSSQEQEINSLVEQATSLFFAHNKDASKTLPVFVKEYVMKKTMNPTLATICETVAKDNEKNLTETVEGKGPQMLNEAAGSTPRTPRERKLAAMAHPKDKITHKDVLVGRGVVAKEEMDRASFGKKYKENEENNKHSENVVLLAKHFGSKADVDKANEILNKHMDLGYLSKDLGDARYKLHQKLMPKASDFMKEEVKQIDELKSSTLASYTVKASKSAMGTAAAGDSRTTKNRKFGIERAVSKLYKRAPDAPKDPWEDPKFYNAQFKNRQESTDTPGNSYKHQCAIHVKHEQFGEGKTIFSQHAEPDQDGNIAWYDVMFEHGIEKKVSINEIQVLQSESHMMHKKKKMKEEVEQIDEISNKLKNNYLEKARESLKKSAPFSKEEDKRSTGIARAKGLIPTKEEVEQIDEISDDLRKSYLKGAKKYFRDRERNDPYGNITDKDINRTVGVQRATDTMKSPEPAPVKKKKMKEEVEQVDEAMKWDETSSSSLPAKDQDTIKGHQEASIWHAKMLAHLSTMPDNPSTRRNKYFFSKRMAHHNGAAHDMRMQGVKEEVEQVDEASTDVAWFNDPRFRSSMPKLKQPSADAHERAAQFHREELKVTSDYSDRKYHRERVDHHQRAAETMKEEVINELSKDTVGSYALKAHRKGDMAARMSKNANDDMGKIARKRYGYTQLAIKKLSGNARVNATEEVEQVDEMMSDPETLRADRSAETRTTPSGRKIVVKKPKKELKVEDVEYVDEAKRGRPRKNPLPAGQAPEEGDKEHFIMQLRKSVSMRGKKDVEFDNGEKMKVPAHVASAVLDHYNSLKTAEQKDRLHKSVSKTPKHLMSHYEMYHGN